MMSSWIEQPELHRRVSRSRWDAIVVGSGVGGAAAAGIVAAAGRRVLVLEKNDATGGILASYRRGGFKIDFGSHLLSRGARGPIGALLRQLGLKRPRLLTHPMPVRSRGMFDMPAPEHRAGLVEAALEASRRLGLGTGEVLRLAKLLAEVLAMPAGELEEWDRRTLAEYVLSRTRDVRLFYLFSFLASVFFILPPWEVSAGEALRCLRHFLRDYSLSYVEGGMDSLPNAVLGRVTAAGGELVTGARAISIEPRRSGRLAVTLADGAEVEAPLVACNMPPSELLRLLPPSAVPPAWRERVEAIQPSGNAHQLKLALRRPLVQEGCLIGGISLSKMPLGALTLELMERTVAALDRGEVADPLPVYAPVPTNFDPTLAPPGCQLIVASIYGPTRADPLDPPAVWREKGIAAMASVVPHLLDELIFAEMTPVPVVGAWMGRRTNAAISNGQRPGQVGADRLPVVTPVRGLYLCGDGAGGSGIGTELAAASGMEAARAMLCYEAVCRTPAQVEAGLAEAA